MNYLNLLIVGLILAVIGTVVYLFLSLKPPGPTPQPTPGPTPNPSQRPSWPMEKEVFFVEISNNPKLVDYSSQIPHDCVYDLSNSDPDEQVYVTMLDYIRMYQGYRIADIYKDILPAVQNGMDYKNGTKFEIYSPTLLAWSGDPNNTDPGYPLNYSLSNMVTINTQRYSHTLDVDKTYMARPTENTLVYPVYGYKPIQQLSDAKDNLFMRKTRTENANANPANFTYVCPQSVQFGVSPVTWSINGTSWLSRFTYGSMTSAIIQPFNAENWSYNDIVKTSSNMTEGKELFLLGVSNPLTAPTLNTDFTFGTLDQFQYCASKGANICQNGWLYDSGRWIGGMNSNTSNPNGLKHSSDSGEPHELYAQSYGTNNWTETEPYMIDSTKSGYCTEFSKQESKTQKIVNSIGWQADPSYYTVAENVVDIGNYNPDYYFVWGVKPKDPKVVSPQGTSIQPFMFTQDGSTKYSMYD